MKSYAKTKENLNPCQTPTEQSFFSLIDKIWKGTLPKDPLRRFFTLMRKMKVSSFIKEDIILNEELLYERDSIQKKYSNHLDEFTAIRISCFWTDVSKSTPYDLVHIEKDHLLGYAVIVNYTISKQKQNSYLFESVVREPCIVIDKKDKIKWPPTNYYLHNCREFSTIIGTQDNPIEFTIKGSYFSQQNEITSTCGYAALRMAVNSNSFKLLSKLDGNKITNRLIDEALEKRGETFESTPSLSYDQIEYIVTYYGGRCLRVNFNEVMQSLLHIENINNPSSFVLRLHACEDNLSSYIWKRFSADTQQYFKDAIKNGYSQKELEETLVKALNDIIEGEVIYQRDRFNNIILSPETSTLKENLTDNFRSLLNRMLLQDAFHGIVENCKFIEYDHYLYPYIESGIPVFLGIHGRDVKQGKRISHLVAIMGHTLNTDRWVEYRQGYGANPSKFYFSISEWCDHFMINDDNYGMYITLPLDMVRFSRNENFYAAAGIAIIPNEVTLSGYSAEKTATLFFLELLNQIHENPPSDPMPVWFDRLIDFEKEEKGLVYRTYLLKKNRYIECNIDKLPNPDEQFKQEQRQKISQLLEELPNNYLWVSEVSLPHLYTGNQSKLGEIVIKCNATGSELEENDAVVLSWGPGYIYYGNNKSIESWFVDTHVSMSREKEVSPFEFPSRDYE